MQRAADQVLDELLVLEAQDGGREALDELVRRWHARLLRHAWHLTGRHDHAAEVAQESWLAIVRGLRRLDDPAVFRAWAYRIVTNQCASFVRRRRTDRRALEFGEPTAPATTASTVDQQDEAHQLHDAMRRLGTDQRAILSLRYWEDMSTREIAAVLRVPEGTVKSRLNQARNELQQLLTRSERDDSVERQTS